MPTPKRPAKKTTQKNRAAKATTKKATARKSPAKTVATRKATVEAAPKGRPATVETPSCLPTPKKTVPVAPVAPGRDEIAARAQEIWRERGSQEGDSIGNWLQAEKELNAERGVQA